MEERQRLLNLEKTIERQLYIEVEDNPEGLKVIQELVEWLTNKRDNKSYLNGWIGPVTKK